MGWKSGGWRSRKGSQQSLYRFEDRLQSSIVTILRDPNNLAAPTTAGQLYRPSNFHSPSFSLAISEYSFEFPGSTVDSVAILSRRFDSATFRDYFLPGFANGACTRRVTGNSNTFA